VEVAEPIATSGLKSSPRGWQYPQQIILIIRSRFFEATVIVLPAKVASISLL
jgi:hypothetical protein